MFERAFETLAVHMAALCCDVTPDPKDFSSSDSEPEDLLSPEEVEQPRRSSTPNASLVSPDPDLELSTTPEQSFGTISGGEATFMALLRETNATVKGFDTRLDALEQKVAELGQKDTTTTGTSCRKWKAADTDEIRVSCTLPSKQILPVHPKLIVADLASYAVDL